MHARSDCSLLDINSRWWVAGAAGWDGRDLPGYLGRSSDTESRDEEALDTVHAGERFGHRTHDGLIGWWVYAH